MKVGFTGTREGMTPAQKDAVYGLLDRYKRLMNAEEFIHGGCPGSDREAAAYALQLGYEIIVHPGDEDQWDHYKSGEGFWHRLYDPRPYLTRNGTIVADSAWMIATPKESSEIPRGGTWHTVRLTRMERKDLTIVFPDGSLREERG